MTSSVKGWGKVEMGVDIESAVMKQSDMINSMPTHSYITLFFILAHPFFFLKNFLTLLSYFLIKD